MKSKGNKKGRARKRSKKVKEGMKSRKVGEAGKGREEQEKKAHWANGPWRGSFWVVTVPN